MKATDLMIGDWVLAEGKPTRVADIDEFEGINRCWIAGCEDGGCIQEKDIKPIPLTKEILEKNGYTCKKSLDEEIISHNWISPDRRVTLNDQNGSPWFCIICSKGMMREVMIGVKYVHELQHALRMCGIENGIVL